MKKQELRLEGNVVYQDAGLKSEVLVSHALGLKGKPDLLTRVDNVIIPVDKKRGKKRRPFDSQVLQLAAYCALVEERYGVRPPKALIRFDDGDWGGALYPAARG